MKPLDSHPCAIPRSALVAELADCLRANLPLDPGCRAHEECDEDAPPSLSVTLGLSIHGNGYTWGFQTGDNSFSGSAYGHPFWGVGTLTDGDDCAKLAEELFADATEQYFGELPPEPPTP